MKLRNSVITFGLLMGLTQNHVFAQYNASIDLSDLDGQNGFAIHGVEDNGNSGFSVSSAGDVNNDGIDDLIIGEIFADSSGAGFVVYGSTENFSASFQLSSLTGLNGAKINGVSTADQLGRSVSAAGDVNGDGIDDIIIGASSADPDEKSSAGISYVVFGSNNGLPNPLDLTTLDGSNGFSINGEAAGDSSGRSVSGAGDLNNDGFDDVIIGAPFARPNDNVNAGNSYVVFGSNNGFSTSLELSSLDGSNGLLLSGDAVNDEAGFAVNTAGDVNGDGIDDVIVGAGGTDDGLSQSGNSYVVYGSNESFPAELALSSINANNGSIISGENAFDRSGESVSTAGDINGDGINDFIIGSKSASRSYVVYGSSNGLPATIALSSLNGQNGFAIHGETTSDHFGVSVSEAGDINGDGMADLIVGAGRADPGNVFNVGSSYVIFGSNSMPNPLDVTNLDGTNGFVINGVSEQDEAGNSVSSAGDINGDGIDDIIIGATSAGDSGVSYVVFGREKPIFKNGFE